MAGGGGGGGGPGQIPYNQAWKFLDFRDINVLSTNIN